jgi:hypothetical protein
VSSRTAEPPDVVLQTSVCRVPYETEDSWYYSKGFAFTVKHKNLLFAHGDFTRSTIGVVSFALVEEVLL